jgi:hypothetical protein
LADGRDLLLDIIKKEWSPSFTLLEIIKLIPKFIVRARAKRNKMLIAGYCKNVWRIR